MTTTKTERTPGLWSPQSHTFESAQEVLHWLENCCIGNGTHAFTCHYVTAKEPDGEDVTVAFLGNGPRGAVHAHLVAAAPLVRDSVVGAALERGWLPAAHDDWHEAITYLVERGDKKR